MRQAGRSLPEYRALREKHRFFEIAGTPELCAEVTLQPVRRHGVDAAVLFADIMSPVLGMGVDVELVEGVGPVVDERIDSAAAVERLQVVAPEEWATPILEAVRLVRSELEPERALVGFCGGPFTVAGYLVEGKPSRDFVRTKSLMYREPETWHALMERLTGQFAPYVAATAAAGADAIQLFDSWVGALSVADYREFVAPYSARVLEAAGVPTIHFGTGTTPQLLAEMAAAGGTAVGVDWRVPLDDAWAVVGEERAVQGNLARADGPDTSSISATASFPRRIRTCSPGSPSSYAVTVGRHEERGRAHGVRVAGTPGGRSRVLRRHPRWPPGSTGASRGSRRALPAARDRGFLAAERDHRADARSARR
jgi:uroporphyrinogen decarboxylase